MSPGWQNERMPARRIDPQHAKPSRCEAEHPRLLALLAGILHHGDIFVDVGANTGFFAVPLASVVGSGGKVLAFEPAADSVRRLRDGARRRGVSSRISIYEIALGSEDGSRVLSADPEHPFDSTKRSLFIGGPAVGEVPMRTFDGMVDRGEVELPTGMHAVKIDVEGAEFHVLTGMRAALERHRPRIVVAETIERHLNRAGSSVGEVHRFMASLGYAPNEDVPGGEPLELNAVFKAG